MKRIIAVAVLAVALVGCQSSSNGSMDASMDKSMSGQSIAEIAMGTGMHNTLVAALKAAGLADMLMAKGQYTVFAPTDEAFAKLPAGTVDMLLLPENREKLKSVLQYHVVPGNVNAKKVMKMKSAKSVSGKMLTVSMMGDTVMINDSHVVKADVMANNGTIHVIDTVLMPPM